MKKLFTSTCFIFLLTHSYAQNIFQHIKAEVTSVDDYSDKLNNQLHTGDTIYGTLNYSYDPPDNNPDVTIGDYPFVTTPYGFVLHGPGNLVWQTFASNVDFLCEVQDFLPADGGDLVMFKSYNNYYSSGDNATDKVISWAVNKPDGTNLNSDALPIILDLSIWDQLYGLTIGADDFPDGSIGYFIRAHVFDIITDEGTGFIDGTSINQKRIFPNPVHSSFMITNTNSQDAIIIEDLSGKLMMNARQIPNYIDIHDFPAGIYLVKIIGEKSTEVFKAVKN